MTNFWAAVEQFLNEPIAAPQQLECRLYYNDIGEPLFYTMDKPDGQYINISLAQYSKGNYNVKVVNEQIKEILHTIAKLVPSDTGTASHCNDVSIIADQHCCTQHWKLKAYEEN
jgi:hypothetical protein